MTKFQTMSNGILPNLPQLPKTMYQVPELTVHYNLNQTLPYALPHWKKTLHPYWFVIDHCNCLFCCRCSIQVGIEEASQTTTWKEGFHWFHSSFLQGFSLYRHWYRHHCQGKEHLPSHLRLLLNAPRRTCKWLRSQRRRTRSPPTMVTTCTHWPSLKVLAWLSMSMESQSVLGNLSSCSAEWWKSHSSQFILWIVEMDVVKPLVHHGDVLWIL